MTMTEAQTVELNNLSESISKVLMTSFQKINNNGIVIDDNAKDEYVKDIFDKIFKTNTFVKFLKENHQTYNLINIMGSEMFIKHICEKLNSGVSFTEKESQDLFNGIKECFSTDEVFKHFTKSEFKSYISDSEIELEDVFA